MTDVKKLSAWVVLTSLLTLVGCHEDPAGTSRDTEANPAETPREVEARPVSSVSLLLEQMASADLTDRRLAQVHLAHKGTDALATLAAASDTRDDRLEQSIREVVALMLLKSVEWTELSQYPRLRELCRPQFEQARAHARHLAGADRYDSGEHGLRPPGPPPPLSPEREALYAMVGLHGWAVPAAVELCADDMPSSRLYGAEVLRYVQAWGQTTVWQSLLQDDGAVTIFRGCYDEHTTVAGAVGDCLRVNSSYRDFSDPNAPRHTACVAEGYALWLGQFDKGGPASPIDTTLTGMLRQYADTMAATSWDDYWNRAEPVLRDTWK